MKNRDGAALFAADIPKTRLKLKGRGCPAQQKGAYHD
jgi:hypothetical protein